MQCFSLTFWHHPPYSKSFWPLKIAFWICKYLIAMAICVIQLCPCRFFMLNCAKSPNKKDSSLPPWPWRHLLQMPRAAGFPRGRCRSKEQVCATVPRALPVCCCACAEGLDCLRSHWEMGTSHLLLYSSFLSETTEKHQTLKIFQVKM